MSHSIELTERPSTQSDAPTLAPTLLKDGEPAGEHGETAERVQRSLTWWQACIIITAATNSLGELALADEIAGLGIMPSAIVTITLGLISGLEGYVMYLFCLRYPDENSYAGLMGRALGRWARWVGMVMQTLLLEMVIAAHLVAWRDTVEGTSNGKLNGFAAVMVGLVAMAVFTVGRGMKDSTHLSVISLMSIVASISVATVGVRKAYSGPIRGHLFSPAAETSAALIGDALSSSLFVNMGQIAYPSIMAEMKDPRHFPRVLIIQTVVSTCMALWGSIYFYAVAGSDVASPVLGSGTNLLSRVAYGLAIPTIALPAVICCMVAAGSVYKLAWTKYGRPEVVLERSFRARGSWLLIVACGWGIALALALTVPDFERIIPFSGAIFGPFFVLIVPPFFWLRLHWDGSWSTLLPTLRKRRCKVLLFFGIYIIGWIFLALGLCGSVVGFMTVPSNLHAVVEVAASGKRI